MRMIHQVQRTRKKFEARLMYTAELLGDIKKPSNQKELAKEKLTENNTANEDV